MTTMQKPLNGSVSDNAQVKRPTLEARIEMYRQIYQDFDLKVMIEDVKIDLKLLEERGEWLHMADCALALSALCYLQAERAIQATYANMRMALMREE